MTPLNPKSGDVVSVRPLGAALAGTNKSSLFKTDALQVVRLVLPAGKEIAPHRASRRSHGPMPGRPRRVHGRRGRPRADGRRSALPSRRRDARPARHRRLLALGHAPAALKRAVKDRIMQTNRSGSDMARTSAGTFPIAGTAAEDARLLAGGQLPFGRPDLPPRQPAIERAFTAKARQAPAARTLGHDARPELHLRPPQPSHQGTRPGRALCLRPRPRRPRHGGQRLSGGRLQRGLSEHKPG